MAVRVQGLVFAGVGSNDPSGAARFLAEVLGVEPETDGDAQRLVLGDGSSVAVVPRDWVDGSSDTLLGFLVDDVESATAELAARGIEPAGELRSGFGLRYRHFEGPDGRRIELVDRRG
jgi:hypothetical protein